MVALSERERRAIPRLEGLSVSQWAERYRVLDRRATKEPGPWRNERVPYLAEVMDCFCDYEVEEIVLCFAAQSGKTEAIFNMVGYAIDQDPGPALVVFPTEDICAYVSRNRIQPMIQSSPRLKERLIKDTDVQIYEMRFETMTLYLAWANSPAQLASKPIRYLFLDEVDKYPPFSGREADPIALAEKRTTSYFGFHKVVVASTPTVEEGNIWKRLNSCTCILRYAVPCPFCGEYQFLKFENLRWETDSEGAPCDVHYECEHCGEHIYSPQKQEMLLEGKWVPVKEGDRRRVGFHLSALYSPFLPWERVAEEFVASKDDPAKLMDFINSRLAEPFKEVEGRRREQDVLKWKTDLPAGMGPENTVAFVAGIDTQKDGFYYTVYAAVREEMGVNSHRLDFYLVDYGFVRSWDDLDALIYRKAYQVKGVEGGYHIMRAFIDAGGDKTMDVLSWAGRRRPVVFPVRGLASAQVKSLFRESKKDGQIWVNSAMLKDEIAYRLEAGGLYLHAETGPDFAAQIVAEEKRRIRKGFRMVEEWVRVRRENHYLDCTVYAMCAAYHLGCLFWEPIGRVSTPKSFREVRVDNFRVRTGWLRKRPGWLKK